MAAGTSHYLVLDTESIPDGKLLGMVKYAGEKLDDAAAVEKAQAEARSRSPSGSDFLPVTFHIPVAVCVVPLDVKLEIQALACLDAPAYRPAEIVKQFWERLTTRLKKPPSPTLITYNGRSFDLPLLEMAAFRYGYSCREYIDAMRKRFGNHLDLMEWFDNYGAARHSGGLNLLSKVLGKPGKMDVAGHQVYEMHRAGKLQEINDYCMFDTLDTYFVFLRSRVMTGEISIRRERELVQKAKDYLASRVADLPALGRYLENWGDWQPWP